MVRELVGQEGTGEGGEGEQEEEEKRESWRKGGREGTLVA